MSLRKIPKRVLAPDNGKDGRSRITDKTVFDQNHDEIDWSIKSSTKIKVNYPNDREVKTESVCPAGALHGKRCKECTCRGED